MAKYTETFAEWLNAGGQLPAEFSAIDGFPDMFVGNFCDHEIGFETPELFGIKLKTRAAVVIPVYSEKIKELNAAIAGLSSPQKEEKTVFEQGKQTSKKWELPINASVEGIEPSNIETAESNADITTRTYSGYTADEAKTRVEFAERETVNIIERLLHEFDNLFMKVY